VRFVAKKVGECLQNLLRNGNLKTCVGERKLLVFVRFFCIFTQFFSCFIRENKTTHPFTSKRATPMNTPVRGDIWFVRLHPTESPVMAVVINSNHEEYEPEIFAVIPHEARATEFRLDVPVTNRIFRDGVFNVQRITSIQRSQFEQSLGVILPRDLDTIEHRLYTWLDL
jgi:mRNA-degrading endonuclease toxin of MazEF toxin-antitoxin module